MRTLTLLTYCRSGPLGTCYSPYNDPYRFRPSLCCVWGAPDGSISSISGIRRRKDDHYAHNSKGRTKRASPRWGNHFYMLHLSGSNLSSCIFQNASSFHSIANCLHWTFREEHPIVEWHLGSNQNSKCQSMLFTFEGAQRHQTSMSWCLTSWKPLTNPCVASDPEALSPWTPRPLDPWSPGLLDPQFGVYNGWDCYDLVEVYAVTINAFGTPSFTSLTVILFGLEPSGRSSSPSLSKAFCFRGALETNWI